MAGVKFSQVDISVEDGMVSLTVYDQFEDGDYGPYMSFEQWEAVKNTVDRLIAEQK